MDFLVIGLFAIVRGRQGVLRGVRRAVLKKFYACMYEKRHIDKENYEAVLEEIKERLDEWVKNR